LKGSSGAIRDLYNIPGTPIVLSCGLDRYLRVFNYKTYEEMPQIYMKTKLNTLYALDFGNVQKDNKSGDEEGEDDEAESDEMFEEEDEDDEEEEEEDIDDGDNDEPNEDN
jgi:ribosome biogenesis protein NSA1